MTSEPIENYRGYTILKITDDNGNISYTVATPGGGRFAGLPSIEAARGVVENLLRKAEESHSINAGMKI